MSESTAASPILEYILQSERNLRVAKAVSAEWEAARRMMGEGFCSRLGALLMKRLPGWKWENWDFFASKGGGGFAMFKPEWEGSYYIHLATGGLGERMTYGVLRNINPKNPDNIKGRPHSSLLGVIKKRLDSARANAWWEAQIDLHEPASDWSEADVLWKMNKEPEFLEKVASQLHEVAQLSEKIVDSLIVQYSKKKK